MRRGFTLVELLAVIVILAVIALITIPAVMKMIDNSTINSYRRSIDLYGKSISNAIIEYQTDMVEKGQKTNVTFDNIEQYIEYEGNDVDCKIKQIYSDKTILLTECYVNEELVLGENNRGYSDENYYYYTNSKKKLKLIEYIKAVEEALKNKNVTATCQVQEDGSITCNGENTKVKSNLENANEGTLVIKNSKVISYSNLKFATEKKTETNNEVPQVIDEENGKEFPTEAGLYDAKYNLLASWDKLINTYGLDIENELTYPSDGVLYKIFNNNPSLQNATILIIGNTTKIGNLVFWNCTNLNTIIIPNSVISIGNQAFGNCTNLKSIIIPSSVTSISYNAFKDSGLTSIKVDKANSKYEDRDSNAIIEKTTDTLTLAIDTTIIPNSVKRIGEGVFFWNTDITNISLSNNITYIGKQSFSYSGLTSITIPRSVTYIEQDAFSNCNNLSSVVFEDTQGWYRPDFGNGNIQADVTNPTTNAENLKRGYYLLEKRN